MSTFYELLRKEETLPLSENWIYMKLVGRWQFVVLFLRKPTCDIDQLDLGYLKLRKDFLFYEFILSL